MNCAHQVNLREGRRSLLVLVQILIGRIDLDRLPFSAVVMGVRVGDTLHVAGVGDSRAYLFRQRNFSN